MSLHDPLLEVITNDELIREREDLLDEIEEALEHRHWESLYKLLEIDRELTLREE